ncbi:SEC-C domain-containing protein [Polyangium jinanense]|uniref:YecA family protein n=1 Tax=Polyangium jinanense TaxID=2829994 RepID=UPI002341C80E|nr:SEC-C domain-containing protein [Polyangium jinanense]MDC3955134.1 SEC-C domain-containing protein [Polyangium jinanense]
MTLSGHAHHFLLRLDRLSVPHLDVALSLYRDDPLLRHILNTARVPEGMERVAISLADPEKGPFLIVTRGGKFVTCLGAGMGVRNLHVIPRERLDAITENVITWRERTDRFLNSTGNATELMRALYERGQWLTREQFEGIAVWQPFLALELLKWMIEEAKAVDHMRELLLREVPKNGKLHRRWDETLHGLWCRMWTLGHLSLLAAMDGKAPYQELPAPARKAMSECAYARPAVSQGLVGNAFRGLWGAARLGEELFPHYKKAHGEADNVVEVADSMFTFAAIGLRYPALRAEVKEALSPSAPLPEGRSHLASVRRALTNIFLSDDEDPTDLPDRLAKVGADLAVTVGKRAPSSSPYHFKDAADVPRDLARAALLLIDGCYVAEQELLPVMVMALPWLARAKPEELYLPADYIAAVRVPYEPDYALTLLRQDRRRLKDFRTAEAKEQQTGPARSAPCPCGSGKKYKRCCGDR